MIKFRHLRKSCGTPFGTIAFSKYEDGVIVGVSICHPNDQFSKARGRKIAYGRMISGSSVKIPNRKIDGVHLEDILRSYDNHIWFRKVLSFSA